MWYGILTSRPAGWEECNGTLYGAIQSPDLRDRTPMGTSGTKTHQSTGGGVGGTSGAESGTHIHTAAGTAISTAQMPAHRHSLWTTTTDGQITDFPDHIEKTVANTANGVYMAAWGGTVGIGIYSDGGVGFEAVQNTGGGATHTHTIGVNSAGHTHSTPYFDPKYVALYFLIRVS